MYSLFQAKKHLADLETVPKITEYLIKNPNIPLVDLGYGFRVSPKSKKSGFNEEDNRKDFPAIPQSILGFVRAKRELAPVKATAKSKKEEEKPAE